jgi:hypothetical protein
MNVVTENATSAKEPVSIIPVDRLVKVYVKIRDAKLAFKKEADATLADFDRKLAIIAAELKSRAQQEGVDGFKTEYGTVYMAVDYKVSCADWGAFYQWVKENDELDFLERRIKSAKVKEYMDAHNGELPPGVSVFKELEARVRRSNEK